MVLVVSLALTAIGSKAAQQPQITLLATLLLLADDIRLDSNQRKSNLFTGFDTASHYANLYRHVEHTRQGFKPCTHSVVRLPELN